MKPGLASILALALAVSCGDDGGGARRAGASPSRFDAGLVAVPDAAPVPPIVAFARIEIAKGPARAAAHRALVEILGERVAFAGELDSGVAVMVAAAGDQRDAAIEALAAVSKSAGAPEPIVWWGIGAAEKTAARFEMLLRAPALDPGRFAASFSVPGHHAVALAGDSETGLAKVAGETRQALEHLSRSPELKKALVLAGATGPAEVWIARRFDAN